MDTEKENQIPVEEQNAPASSESVPSSETETPPPGNSAPSKKEGVAVAPERKVEKKQPTGDKKKKAPSLVKRTGRNTSSEVTTAETVILSPKIMRTITIAKGMRYHPFESHLHALRFIGRCAQKNNPYAAFFWDICLAEMARMQDDMKAIMVDTEKMRKYEHQKRYGRINIRWAIPAYRKGQEPKISIMIFNKLMFLSLDLISSLDEVEIRHSTITRCDFTGAAGINTRRNNCILAVRNFWHKVISTAKLMRANEIEDLTVDQLTNPEYQSKIKSFESQMESGLLPKKYQSGNFFEWIKDEDEDEDEELN